MYKQTKKLSDSLQCVIVTTPPVDLPGRLINPDAIGNLLTSLIDSIFLTKTFLTSGPSQEVDGLK